MASGTKRVFYYLKRIPPCEENKDSIIPFKTDEVLIGRSIESNCIIPSHLISRKHAIFKYIDNGWTVTNLSLNGVFVNKTSLPKEKPHRVEVGDEIQFGQPTRFVYKFGMKVLSNLSEHSEAASSPSKRRKLSDENAPVKKLELSFEMENKKLTEKLLTQSKDLQSRLEESQEVQGQLLEEKANLAHRLDQEKEELEQKYQREKQQLEERYAAGSLAQQVMLEETESLAQQLQQKVLCLQEVLEEKSTKVEEKLAKEIQLRKMLTAEKERLTQQLQGERKELEENFQKEKMQLEEKLKSTEGDKNKLIEQVEAKEDIIKESQKRHQELEQQQEELAEELKKKEDVAEKLKKEREELEMQLQEYKHTVKEKESKNQTLEREIQLKEEYLKEQVAKFEEGLLIKMCAEVERKEVLAKTEAQMELERLQQEKQKLEDLLKAAQDEKMQQLRDSLEVEAQKVSLQQEVAIAAEATRLEVMNSVSDVVENEFQCPICNELFITAIVLNCSHTFCKFCINKWKQNKKDCPSCRTPITSETRAIVVDNLIEKMVEALSDDLKERRAQMFNERKAEMDAAEKKKAAEAAEAAAQAAARASSSRSNRRGRRQQRGRGRTRNITRQSGQAIPVHTIETSDDAVIVHEVRGVTVNIHSSDSETSDTSINSDSSSVSGDDDLYYGGYGRCYICGRRGHWANGCPDRY